MLASSRGKINVITFENAHVVFQLLGRAAESSSGLPSGRIFGAATSEHEIVVSRQANVAFIAVVFDTWLATRVVFTDLTGAVG